MKTCILPLDSRPCSYNFAGDLAAISGHEIVLPPIEIMDAFKQPSSFDKISDWIRNAAADCDSVIISVDQLLYGSLLASRQSNISTAEALQRLRFISELKKSNIKIYASTVLMRTTVSTLNMEGKIWWESVSQYSKHSYLADKGDEASAHIVNELKERIPDEVLSEFLAVRERNHEVNSQCVSMVISGIIDYLVVLQEDCTEAGIHKTEQEKLMNLIESRGLGDKIALHNGTDEACTELLARVTASKPMPLKITWLGQNKDFVALFEDRPFVQNLYSHMNTVKLYEDSDASRVLFIYLPNGEQKDFCTDDEAAPVTDYSPCELEAFADEISGYVKKGKEVYLLDVAFANGGDYELPEKLAARFCLSQLHGYSAWNTASNALGTILSQIVVNAGNNSYYNKLFTFSRILDDVIYQGKIRRRINGKLISAGLDPWSLDDADTANALLRQEFDAVGPDIAALANDFPFKFDAGFKWPRTFEVEITMKDGRVPE